MTDIELARKILQTTEGATLAVVKEGVAETSAARGVRPLYELLTRREFLKGASVADKIVGRGAAAIMVTGGVAAVWTPVISHGALEIFSGSDVAVSYESVAEAIINRKGTGLCPVEQLTEGCRSAGECMPAIEKFLKTLSSD